MQAQHSMAEHFTLNYTTIHCVILDTKFTYYVKMLVAARIVSKAFVLGQFFSLLDFSLTQTHNRVARELLKQNFRLRKSRGKYPLHLYKISFLLSRFSVLWSLRILVTN